MIVVLGMHKSGTTLVAELLHHSGVEMGDFEVHLDYNDGNKFEREEFQQINKALLGSEGMQSQDERPVGRYHERKECRLRARGLIQKLREKNGDDWGFKDPRTSFTLDFWADLLPLPKYVFIFRDPREVAQHYYKRFQSQEVTYRRQMVRKAMQAWYLSNKACLKFLKTRGCQHAVFRYNDLLDRNDELERLGLFVGKTIKDVRKPGLRHGRRMKIPELEYYADPLTRWKIRRLYVQLHRALRKSRAESKGLANS